MIFKLIFFPFFIAGFRFLFWFFPPHIDLAWWGGWVVWSNQKYPPQRLIEYNQGGSRLALFMQYKIARFFNIDIYTFQKVLDFILIYFSVLFTLFYFGNDLKAFACTFFIFIIINNPLTQTYFANCETQSLFSLSLIFLLLKKNYFLSSIIIGLLTSFNLTFYKPTYILDNLISLVFVKNKILFLFSSFLIIIIWYFLQKRIGISSKERKNSFFRHWFYFLKKEGWSGLIKRYFGFGREVTILIFVLLIFNFYHFDIKNPIFYFFIGHSLFYFFQLRGFPYHSIPALYSGLFYSVNYIPFKLFIILILFFSLILLYQVKKPFFINKKLLSIYMYNKKTLKIKNFILKNYKRLVKDFSILVWADHINLYWMLKIKPHVDWLRVSTSLSYSMVSEGEKELSERLKKHPPELIVIDNNSLNINAIQKITGFSYKVDNIFENTFFLLKDKEYGKNDKDDFGSLMRTEKISQKVFEKEFKKIKYFIKKKDYKNLKKYFENEVSKYTNIDFLILISLKISESVTDRKVRDYYLNKAVDLLNSKNNLLPLDLYRLASSYKKLGEYEKAEKIFLNLLKSNNSLNIIAGVYFHLGEIEYFRGNRKKAIKYFIKCTKINNNFFKAIEYINRLNK